MSWKPGVLLLVTGLTLLAVRPIVAAEPDPLAADEELLRSARIGTDGPALLEFFRQRTLTGANRDRVVSLVQKLGHPTFRVREQASEDLVKLGSIAVPMLREATKDPDAEVSRRAVNCLEKINTGPSTAQAAAAARLVAARKPFGAAGALFNYLPDAADEGVADEVRTALAAVAVRDGKPDDALVRGLGDRVATRRAAAAQALCRAGDLSQRDAVRKLLKDRDLSVRAQVAVALTLAKDKDAIPVLIALLVDLPNEQAWPVEDLLYRLAGDKAPAVPLGNEPEDRKKCRDAWSTWWQQNGAKLDLARLESSPPLLGLTMLAFWDGGENGSVFEFGPDNKIRREIKNIPWPIDFRVLPGNRLLLAEYYINKVTERNFKGELLWTKQVRENPLAVQRLPNGNTFVAMRGELLIVDAKGNNVQSLKQPTNDVVSAIKTRTGQIYLVTLTGMFKRLDASGKEIKSFNVGPVHNYAAIDVLPNGHILVPQYNNNKIVEFDADGKSVWEAAVTQPTAPVRLPNGHTLVACRDPQITLELDRSGKKIWEHKPAAASYPWRVRRR